MVTGNNTSRPVATSRTSTSIHACYVRLFGEPDAAASAEMEAMAPFIPTPPSAELVLLVALAVHQRVAERDFVRQFDVRQVALVHQVNTVAEMLRSIERAQALRLAIWRLASTMVVLGSAAYLAAQATQATQGRLVSSLQAMVALVVAVVIVRLNRETVWK